MYLIWSMTQTVQSKHILIVDDSLDSQEYLKEYLESNGYTTDCMSNGEEALNFLHSTDKMPQTILLDLYMPVMNGFDFRKQQQNDPILKDIPVVIMSGEEDQAFIREKTHTEVLKKPFSVADLLNSLERNLHLH
jgi:CheY-like chemotaxis protein